MNTKRYLVDDMRHGLKQVRDELGPDAMILSNKRTSDGIEILATADYVAVAKEDAIRKHTKANISGAAGSTETVQRKRTGKGRLGAPFQALLKQFDGEREKDDLSGNPAATKMQDPDFELMGVMRSEIENLRLMLKDQMSYMNREHWSAGHPLQAAVKKRFESQGISATVADNIAARVASYPTISEAWEAAVDELANAIPVHDQDLAKQGGNIALLGPTGAGKTTTIAKLAVRHVLEYGRDSLALVTTDRYRIAAYESLRALGRLVDAPVKIVDEHNSLASIMYSLRDRKLVLIDVGGFHAGENDRREQLAILDDAHADIKRLLVLPASCQSSVLLGAYELFSENPLHGCVLAKVDEAYSLGEVFSLIVEKELPVAYITNGQKIPDDIEVGCPSSLIYRMYEAGVAINSTAHFDCAMPGITELKGKTLNSVHAKHHPTSHV